jgi:hypothetical protein
MMRGLGVRLGVHASMRGGACHAALALALLTVCIGDTTAVRYACMALQPGPGALAAPLRGCTSGACAHDGARGTHGHCLALRGGGSDEEGDSEFGAGEEGPSVKGGTYHATLTVAA